MADFLIALADFDRRRGWESLGHANLFTFVRVELGLSRSGAYWRVSAARLVQRFPGVIAPLRDGRLCMSTTAELAKVLTEENRDQVLPRYFGLSAREAQEVTAELAPRQDPPARDVVTRVEQGWVVQLVGPSEPAPARSLTGVPAVTVTLPATEAPAGAPVQTFGLLPAQPARSSAPPTRDDIEPLTSDLRRLHVTVSREFLRELEQARDGLSHAIPNATTEQVLRAALRLLLEKQARARGLVKRPRSASQTPAPTMAPNETTTPATPQTTIEPDAMEPIHRRTGPREAIPADVRRAVWERDQGRCTWPLDSGGRCGSTHRLEFDHLVPWALFGGKTEDNLRLLCGRQNRLAAQQAFGRRCVERYASGKDGTLRPALPSPRLDPHPGS